MSDPTEIVYKSAPVADPKPAAAAPVVPEVTPAPVTPEVVPSEGAVPPALAEPEVKEVSPIDYASPAAKQVGSMLSDAGVDPAKARDAINANGGKCTPDIYAALVAKHGEGMASLLAGQMSQLHTEGVAKSNAQDNAVYTQVADAFKGITEQSGKETWGELSEWAKTNVTNEDRKALNAVIQQGGMGAKLAVQELINAFQNSGDYSQEMKGIEGDNVPNAPKGGDITRGEYNTQLDALIAKGHNYNTSQEVKSLQARRAKSAQRGL